MVEQEFEHYTQPTSEETKVIYSNWQVVKQRTFAQHRSEGSITFEY